MAFISMLIAGVGLLILIIGLIFFMLGSILDIIWIIRAKKQNKKTSTIYKVFAILSSIMGFGMFVLPVSVILVAGTAGYVNEQRKFNSIEEKVYVDENMQWEDGISFRGMDLVYVDFLHFTDVDNRESIGAVVFPNEEYYEIYDVPNEGDYDIYYVDRVGKIYCEKEQYDLIYNYYYSDAKLDTTIHFFQNNEEDEKIYDCEFDTKIFFEIADYYHTREKDYSVSSDEIKQEISVWAKSSDGLFYESLYLVWIDDNIALECSSGSDNGISYSKGILLDDEVAQYVQEQIDTYCKE